MLPLKALLGHIPETPSFKSFFDFSQIIHGILLFANILFILINLRKMGRVKNVARFLIYAFFLVLVFALQPVFLFGYTKKLTQFVSFFQILSWLTIIPLAAIAFRSSRDFFQLRRSCIITFLIFVVGFMLANVLSVGRTAYDLGIFYLGVWKDLAPLSMALLALIPLFFLPSGARFIEKPITRGTLIFVMVDLVLILLLTKRSSILAMLICISTILYLFGRHQLINFSVKRTVFVYFMSFFIISAAALSITLSNPNVVKYRFKDVRKYDKTGDIGHLGAGRVHLITNYVSYFKSLSLMRQVFGVDIISHVDRRPGGYLYSGLSTVPHNDYIEVLLRSGIVGLSLYTGLLAYILFLVVRCYSQSGNALAAQVSGATIGMFALYLVSSIAGMMFRVLAMSCFGMLVGACLGICSSNYYPSSEEVKSVDE
jgi:hypothetical protein